ncbi:putative disease resistance protein RGA4 [Oryza brachyantha]|uniref:putative disease resistance protein RGA4 n=1 Tax=Oryza brachyantha TaxID=4533 RepID=UPI001ADD32C5|nr:putative disease resistance protein RGA4 [Oryza brachyantha]
MAESLLLPVVRGLTGKATDALVRSVTRVCGVDGDRRRLERQLLAVQCMLSDAEAKSETNPAVKRWMKDLKAVAYEADDVLDDFRYEALRREAQIGDAAASKVLGFFTPHNTLLFRAAMSRKLSGVLEKMNELVEEMNRFGLVQRAEPPELPYRQTHSAPEEPADILGRDDDKEVVVKLLLEQRDEHRLQVVAVVGMGGLGKTTLAKMVYNDPQVTEHFQLKMWHCVSDNFEPASLLKSVIELAKNGRCEMFDTIELLRRQLEEAIDRKRFLLVLDDVWNEEEKKWEDDLKPLLNSVGGPGSVMVVTTRSQRVASIMGTLGTHELHFLNEDDSWELFSKRAFSRQVQEQVEFVSFGKIIVNKCRGLPLALKTMGGLMSSKHLVSEWEAIAESNIGDRLQGKNDVMDILKLSYRHLSSEMKQCFAFCGVFPKYYEMEKDILIQLWMANGFIQEHGNVDLSHKGELIFYDLVWRSFLEDVKVKKMHWYEYDRDPVICKMHDLMHDLAKDVTNECATTAREFCQEKRSAKDVCHMLPWDISEEMVIELFKGVASLRTLMLPSEFDSDILKKLRPVTIRALQWCPWLIQEKHLSNLLSHVMNAKHLRYLDLTASNIVRLPNSICMLYNLQTLKLNGCASLRKLPEGMRTMRKLIHIYLHRCNSLQQTPPYIGRLNNLRTLTKFFVLTKSGCGIEELKDLRHLANRLEVYGLRKIKCKENAKEACLHQKQNLSELLMYWDSDEFYMPENKASNEEEVLEALAPHGRLKVLKLYGYSGLKIPQWMSDPQMLQCLTTLHISNFSGCKDLSTLWLSNSLEHLCLSRMDNLTTLCKNVGVGAEGYTIPLQVFPKLKFLKLEWLPSLEKWAENVAGEANDLVTIPELERLCIGYCPKLASVPDCPVLKELYAHGSCSLGKPLGSWPSLVKLHVSSLVNTVATLKVDAKQVPLENLRSLRVSGNLFTPTYSFSKMHLELWKCFAFVEDLDIDVCSDLVYWPHEELTNLIHLRYLSIADCNNLEGKGSSSEETMSLPHLEMLCIKSCNSLLEIPSLPASLEDIEISDCPRLVALPSNLGDLAKLESLHLSCCISLKELPDGMYGLTSLEELNIEECPGIEKFPQGLLQRLPTLETLTIEDCPGLERWCREAGVFSLALLPST